MTADFLFPDLEAVDSGVSCIELALLANLTFHGEFATSILFALSPLTDWRKERDDKISR